MNKRILSLLVALTVSVFGFSQLILPTSLNFSGQVIPDGWTTNPDPAQFYPSSGNPSPALKFTSSGHYLIGELASTPGDMKYDITANPVPSVPWNGIFEVQESVDGTTYSVVKTHNSSNMQEQTYQTNTVQLSPSTRYVKFLFVEKNSGNVGLDNIIIQPGAIDEQDMRVVVEEDEIAPQQLIYTSANIDETSFISFVLQNVGAIEDLEVSDIELTGLDVDMFSFENEVEFPLFISAMSSEEIGINFTPISSGTKNATVTIYSNDLDFPEFSFHLVGYGDNLATEPTEQASNLSFSNVKTYRVMGDFTPSSDAEGYLVLRKIGSNVTGEPTDGVVYTPGDIVGDAIVVKSSASTNFVPSNIIAGTDYHFSIFAYNGVGTGTNYLTTSPLTGNQETPADMIPEDDYMAINTTSPTLINDLYSITSPHQQFFYGDYAPKLVDAFYARDTTDGKRVVTCQYTGNNYLYDYPFSFAGTGMSREHTFASSWFPISNDEANFYSDFHNLLLLHQNDANAIRSNYPLGVVVSDTLQHIGGSVIGKNNLGQWVYEPTDATKGTAARAMMYMCVRYTENGIVWKLPEYISATIPYGQDQTILKQWNAEFPPSNLEIARNDFIDSLQHNRNPFIDHPEYACYIDFMTMDHLVDGCDDLSIIEEMLSQSFIVYPNPAKETVTIAVDGTKLEKYTIFDKEGRVVLNGVTNSVIAKEINISHLTKGIYMVTAQTEYGAVSKRFVVE